MKKARIIFGIWILNLFLFLSCSVVKEVKSKPILQDEILVIQTKEFKINLDKKALKEVANSYKKSHPDYYQILDSLLNMENDIVNLDSLYGELRVDGNALVISGVERFLINSLIDRRLYIQRAANQEIIHFYKYKILTPDNFVLWKIIDEKGQVIFSYTHRDRDRRRYRSLWKKQ